MRSKEDAMDYRYFPDPDLPPLMIDDAWIERVRAAMPETQDAKKSRFMSQYTLSAYDARLLSSSRAQADFFEDVARAAGVAVQGMPAAAGTPPTPAAIAKAASNWMTGEFSAALNAAGIGIEASPVRPAGLARLIALTLGGVVSNKLAKEVFAAMWAGENAGDPDAIVAARGLQQISDSDAIGRIVDEVLAANAQQVADYRAGKEKAFNSLVGQVMKATRGKANPAQVNDLLKKKLGG